MVVTDLLFLVAGMGLGSALHGAAWWATTRYEIAGRRVVRRWYAPRTTVFHRTRGQMVVRDIDTAEALHEVWVYAESALEGHSAAWVPLSSLYPTAGALLDAAAEQGRRDRPGPHDPEGGDLP